MISDEHKNVTVDEKSVYPHQEWFDGTTVGSSASWKHGFRRGSMPMRYYDVNMELRRVVYDDGNVGTEFQAVYTGDTLRVYGNTATNPIDAERELSCALDRCYGTDLESKLPRRKMSFEEQRRTSGNETDYFVGLLTGVLSIDGEMKKE